LNRKTLIMLYVATELVSFLLHVVIQQWTSQLGWTDYTEYDWSVKFWGGASDFLPATLAFMILFAIWDKLPGRVWWQKGLVFCAFILILRGGLFIPFIMGLLVEGASIFEIVIYELTVWIPKLVWGLGFAFIIDRWKKQAA